VKLTKDNILYAIIGLLAGAIIGYLGTGALNRTVPPAAVSSATPPAGHPEVGAGAGAGTDAGGMQADVSATLGQARSEPQNFAAQMKAGSLYYQIKRYDTALEYFERAYRLKPDEVEVLVALGNANFDLGRFSEAERWYKQALERRPDDVDVRTDLGLSYYLREPRDLDRAIEAYRGSLRLDPRHEKTLQNLITALIEKGEGAEARRWMERLAEVNPENPALAQFRSRLGGP
jgi:tetratricopeptide (TPR) repeat protein